MKHNGKCYIAQNAKKDILSLDGSLKHMLEQIQDPKDPINRVELIRELNTGKAIRVKTKLGQLDISYLNLGSIRK